MLNVIDGREKCAISDEGGPSICNHNEAEFVATIIKLLITLPALKKKSIWIITFYQKQEEIIKKKIFSKYLLTFFIFIYYILCWRKITFKCTFPYHLI